MLRWLFAFSISCVIISNFCFECDNASIGLLKSAQPEAYWALYGTQAAHSGEPLLSD